jgi:glutaconyl-CoA/methylmalonyl-CoA decarboxylase subunit gamma
MKRLKVTVDGKTYDVIVELIDPAPAAGASIPIAPPPAPAPVVSAPIAAPVVASAPKPTASGDGDVTSPLAGKLVSIDAKLGQDVAEGSQVATVEAMKMNTYIYAPKAGKVAAVLINPGDAVEEGSVILHIT